MLYIYLKTGEIDFLRLLRISWVLIKFEMKSI